MRQRRSGTPLERAMTRVDRTGQCWLWLGPVTADGYGKTAVASGRVQTSHRFFYEQLVGPIPDGLQLDHLCRVRNCVNPAHLEPVTVRENTLRSEGFAARHARQTHCLRGHEFTESNTYMRRNAKGGISRTCRTCKNEWSRQHRAS